ncbi:MAG: hypothetical protein ACAI44_36260 [Candidatus Sericytochromatia bacterium]
MPSVQQLTTSLVDRTLGVELTRPAFQFRQPADPAPLPATKPAPDRAQFSALPTGRVPAADAAVQQAFGAQTVKAGGSVPAPVRRPLGEDLAWIAFKDKTPVELATYVQDPAVMAMADMAVIDPGRRRLEHDVKQWLGFDHQSPDPAEGTEIDLLKLGLGAKVSGLSKEQLAIQPSIDLIKIRTPGIDDLSLTAGFPINLAGQVHLRTHIQLQKGLDPEGDQALDTRVGYDSQDNQLQFRFGLRQRTGQDEAVSLYVHQITPFDNRPIDLGVGMYVSKQWF